MDLSHIQAIALRTRAQEAGRDELLRGPLAAVASLPSRRAFVVLKLCMSSTGAGGGDRAVREPSSCSSWSLGVVVVVAAAKAKS